jgi:hypothetical protein
MSTLAAFQRKRVWSVFNVDSSRTSKAHEKFKKNFNKIVKASISGPNKASLNIPLLGKSYLLGWSSVFEYFSDITRMPQILIPIQNATRIS